MARVKERSWFYQTFICGHWYSGQIRSTRKQYLRRNKGRRARHYRECQKCGKKEYIN